MEEPKPLFYKRELGNYPQVPRLKRLQLANVVEQAIRFRCKGLPFNYLLASVCCAVSRDIKLTHPKLGDLDVGGSAPCTK